MTSDRLGVMACPECLPNKQQRGRGVCPGLSLRPGSMCPGKRYCETRPFSDAGSTTPEQTQFPGEKRGVSVPAARAAGRRLAHPRVVYLPRTATGGYNRPVGLVGGIYLVYSGDVRPVLEINSNGHGWGGASGTGCAGHGGGVTKWERLRGQKKTAPLHHGEAVAWRM